MRVQIDTEKLTIVGGPGATRLLEVAVVLMDDALYPQMECAFTPNTRVRFTAMTKGTLTSITIKITLISLKLSMNSSLYYYFEGIASRGVKVRGYYSLEGSGDIEEVH